MFWSASHSDTSVPVRLRKTHLKRISYLLQSQNGHIRISSLNPGHIRLLEIADGSQFLLRHSSVTTNL